MKGGKGKQSNWINRNADGAPCSSQLQPHVSHSTRETQHLLQSPHTKTHSSKPGSGDNLPWARSTYGHRLMKDPYDMLQLSGSGTHGMQLLQPTCPMSTSLTNGRGSGSGSWDRRSKRADEGR